MKKIRKDIWKYVLTERRKKKKRRKLTKTEPKKGQKLGIKSNFSFFQIKINTNARRSRRTNEHEKQEEQKHVIKEVKNQE